MLAKWSSSLVTMLVVGCGANVVFDDPEGTGGDGGLDCEDISFDFDSQARICAENERCSILGALEDGRDARIECGGDPPACGFFVENERVCSCPDERIDWANVCPNGIPTCGGWRIDYSDALFTCQSAP